MESRTITKRVLKRADPSTIQDKFLVGYQGWFTCAGDGEPIDPGHHGWLHWFNQPIPMGGKPNTDLWPDVSEYSPSELFPTPGIKFKSGEPATLFSSRHPQTVQRHFNWMARHGVDGVFLQRFLGVCDFEKRSKGAYRLRDEIGDRVREAAEKEGRVYAMMYDFSGVESDRILPILQRDWKHLIHNKGVLNSPNYLREKGMPVVALWGLGFNERNHTPELVREIARYVRSVTPGGAYIMAGTATYWRSATGDADPNPAFLDVWLNEFDAISPWLVGRLKHEEDVDRFAEHQMKLDIELLKKHHEEGKRKIDYIPVIYPGFSGLNLSGGEWGLNMIKRNGGKFMWQQIFNAKRLGVRIIYGAMWDEYDEGTALMPVVEKTRMLPESDKFPFLALDADGYDLPSDWYMRICGFAAEGLRSERMVHETFPSKELQDYWSTRPRYEECDATSGEFVSGSSSIGSGGGQSYEEWLQQQKEGKDELPPPPYSLEAEEASAAGQSQPQTTETPTSTDSRAPNAEGSTSTSDIVSVTNALASQSISSPSLASSSISRPPLHPSHSSAHLVPSASGSTPSASPPPIHPSHLPAQTAQAASGSSSSVSSPPPVHPSRPQPPRPNAQARPEPQASYNSQKLTPSVPHGTHPSRPSAAPVQWPPSDWNVSANRPNRPQSATPYPTYQSPYRPQHNPAATPQVQTYDQNQVGVLNRPHSSNAIGSPHLTGPSAVSFPEASVGMSSNSASSYSPQPPVPNSNSYGPPTSPVSPHMYSTDPSVGGPALYQPPEIPYYARPSYLGASSYTPPHTPPAMGSYAQSSYGGADSSGGFAGSQMYQMPSYPGQSSSSYPQYGYAGPPSAGFWASPSPVPHHSVNQPSQPYQSQSGVQFPATSTSNSGFTGFASSTFDRVAGQNTRNQLERQFDNLAQAGSKLFNKFTK